LFRHLTESNFILLGLVMANLGIGLLFLAPSPLPLLLSVMLTGFGLAPFFPTTVALFPQYFGSAANKIAPLMFALGGCGGAFLPWIVGVISTRFGNLRFGLLLPLLCGVVMMGLQLFANKLRAERQAL
jgi:fucose permease